VVAAGASPRPANLACLALAAVFPGSVYEHALFPVSLAVAAGMAFLGLAARRRWTAAGLAGAAAAAAYQPGSCSPPSPPSGCRSSGAGSASTSWPPSAGPSRPRP
jgi:hypothetical protein